MTNEGNMILVSAGRYATEKDFCYELVKRTNRSSRKRCSFWRQGRRDAPLFSCGQCDAGRSVLLRLRIEEYKWLQEKAGEAPALSSIQY